MVRNISYILAIIISFAAGAAQSLKKGISLPIEVSYDKTVHIIFPSTVKYSKSIDNFVVIDRPEEAPYIIRVKANSRDFKRTTTISVATEDGKFFSFLASYKDSLSRTTYTMRGNEKPEETIEVNESSDIHIVAPEKVVYIDYGNESIIASLAEQTENIIRLKANNKFTTPSNLSFALANGEFYTYNIKYTSTLPNVLYTLNADIPDKVILSDQKVSKKEQDDILTQILNRSKDYYSLGLKKSGIRFSILNIYSQKDMIILVMELENTSSIPYDIDYTRYSITAKKKSKKTASQDIDQIGTLLTNKTTRIASKETIKYVVSFPKFTISEDQIFHIDIVEKNGGRNIGYNLDPKSIIDAKSL